MKFISPVFQSACFSGNCGSCSNCCGNVTETLKHGDGYTRSKRMDHISMYMGDETDVRVNQRDYSKHLEKLKRKKLYISPQDPGFFPPKMVRHIAGRPTPENMIYRYSFDKESECDEQFCQINHTFENGIDIPLYKRGDGNHTICVVCIDKMPWFVK